MDKGRVVLWVIFAWRRHSDYNEVAGLDSCKFTTNGLARSPTSEWPDIGITAPPQREGLLFLTMIDAMSLHLQQEPVLQLGFLRSLPDKLLLSYRFILLCLKGCWCLTFYLTTASSLWPIPKLQNLLIVYTLFMVGKFSIFMKDLLYNRWKFSEKTQSYP